MLDLPITSQQKIILLTWAVFAVYLINRGGRNNGIFRIVSQSGLRLIVLGCGTAALVTTQGDLTNTANQTFTNAASNFILILSAAIGANYISHANMSLRDAPNKNDGPEKLPDPFAWLKLAKQKYQAKIRARSKNSDTNS